VLLIWNPVSTGVDAESVGVVSVRAAEKVDLTTRHTIAEGDAKRIAAEAPDAGYARQSRACSERLRRADAGRRCQTLLLCLTPFSGAMDRRNDV